MMLPSLSLRCAPPLLFLLVSLMTLAVRAAEESDSGDTSRGDRMIAEYFKEQTAQLSRGGLDEIDTLAEWERMRLAYRQELLEMLGLDPLPERTDLEATVTGVTEHDDFRVERLHYQSRPGLYVTANLYLPKNIEKPLPAVLYVCGHGRVEKDGVSYGNKVRYHHHGSWFAKNGYVCLTIDTLQLGEIEGIHHGTHRYDMWWWLNRGYTPAGVEAWNCVRAIDYLQSREEVDDERIGVTGRSGGGIYSWWVAAIDDRIRAAVPVAGITDLENYVVDGCVEGHCDCMFLLNTYRWDYPMVAALVAPRPLLLSNTDRDSIFPLDGVVRTHAKVRKIYELYDAGDNLGLNITAGPHKDTQELRVHSFRWFDKHLKGEERLVTETATTYFEPEQLKVFDELPDDQRNTEIHETFVAAADPPAPPADAEQWDSQRSQWIESLEQKVFRAWPQNATTPAVKQAWTATSRGLELRAYDFTSQSAIDLRLYVLQRADLKEPELAVLNVMDAEAWQEFLAAMQIGFKGQLEAEDLPAANEQEFAATQEMLTNLPWVMAYVAPRGVGPTAWDQSEPNSTQIRRRFYLLGQTLEGMQAWDVRRAIQALRGIEDFEDVPLWLQSEGSMAGVALYASLFERDIARLDLHRLPAGHRDGPFLLNVRRYVDMPQAAAMAAERTRLVLYDVEENDWSYVRDVARQLNWDKKQVQFRHSEQSRGTSEELSSAGSEDGAP